MDLTQFRHDVRDALNHLYDQGYLETHPLARTLNVGRPGELRGLALQRLLLEAIQELRPSLEVPYSSLAWRRYRYLYLRYAQAVSLLEIGNDLGISLRQARRYSFDALTAITALLWDRYNVEEQSEGESAVQSELAVTRVDPDVAHVEAGAHVESVSAGELLVSVVATVRPLAEQRGIPLNFVIADGMPTIDVDRVVLRQALLNILTLSLEIGCRTLDLAIVPSRDDSMIQILVRVTRDESVERNTQRIDEEERWYIARHLLQAQHGTVEILPESDGPLTIALRIPSSPRTRVLVIEDNQDVINLYRRYLSDSPYQLLAVTDGTRAVDTAAAEQPTAIVLDVMMPVQDGWEVLQNLKGQAATRAIPVLVCSILKERELALALGATDLLIKPVSRLALLNALAQCCAQS